MLRCSVVSTSTSTDEPVSLADMKLWLRLDTADTAEDGVVQALIATARQKVEERTNRAFITRVFDGVADCAPAGSGPVKLPRSPVINVLSVKGFALSDLTDTGGTAMSSSSYYVDTLSEPGRLVPVGVGWPTATRQANGFIVRFTAGESTSEAGVSERSKSEIKQLVARLFEHRGDELETLKILDEYEPSITDLALPEWG